MGAGGGADSTGASPTANGANSAACSAAPGTSVIIPVGLTISSLMRRNRVTSLGEPGGRLNPRALSVRARLSMRTAPFAVRSASSRTTSTSSS